MTNSRILGGSRVGAETLLGWDVIIGHPSKSSLLEKRDFEASAGAVIGRRCILRSGTVIYENAVLGDDVQTAHHVVVREGAVVGDGCALGNGTVIQGLAKLGRNVRLMEGVEISEAAEIGDDVFIGPGVSLTGGRFMTGALQASGKMTFAEAKALEGRSWEGPSVVIESGARVGANAVILAGVRLGKECMVAAGSVVSADVAPGILVGGNPARVLKKLV